MAKIIDNYILLESICQGQFGEVHKGRNLISKETVAVKTIQMEQFLNDPVLRDMVINEIQALKKLDDPYIVKMIKMLKSSNNIYLIYEFLQGRNLKRLLQDRHTFKESEALEIMVQVCKGLERISKEKISKRNLNSLNVHIIREGGESNGQDGFQVKLKNFFVCKNSTTAAQSTAQTKSESYLLKEFHYVAPELLDKQQGENNENNLCDVFSAGVIFYEMLFGRLPFEKYANSPSDLIEFYSTNDSSELIRQDLQQLVNTSKISENTLRIIKKALSIDKSRRFFIQEFINEINSATPLLGTQNNSTSTTITSQVPSNHQISIQQQYLPSNQQQQQRGLSEDEQTIPKKLGITPQPQYIHESMNVHRLSSSNNYNTFQRGSERADAPLADGEAVPIQENQNKQQPYQDYSPSQNWSTGDFQKKNKLQPSNNSQNLNSVYNNNNNNYGNQSNTNQIASNASAALKTRGRTMADQQGEVNSPIVTVNLNSKLASKDIANQIVSSQSTVPQASRQNKENSVDKAFPQEKRYSSTEHSSKLLAGNIPTNLQGDRKVWEATIQLILDEIMDKRSKIQVFLGALQSCMEQDDWIATNLNVYTCGYILLKKACSLSVILLQIFEKPEIALSHLKLTESQLLAWQSCEKKQLPIKITIIKENAELHSSLIKYQEEFGTNIQQFANNTEEAYNLLLFETSKEMAAISSSSKMRKTLVLAHFLADIAFIDVMYNKFLAKKRLDVLNLPYFKKLNDISREKLQENLLSKFKLYDYHKTNQILS